MPAPRLVTGELRHPLDITKAQRVQDGAGGWTTTYVKVAHARGFIKPLHGREKIDYNTIDARVDISIQLRFNPAFRITPQMQIAYTDSYGVNHVYLIHTVMDIEERHHITMLLCEERYVT